MSVFIIFYFYLIFLLTLRLTPVCFVDSFLAFYCYDSSFFAFAAAPLSSSSCCFFAVVVECCGIAEA